MQVVIPKEIADKLRGEQYNNFDEFRKDFWKAVAETEYAKEFMVIMDLKSILNKKENFMKKLSREEVKDLVLKIRQGLGDDRERNEWIEQIRDSVPNREVIRAIMSGSNASIEEILDKLYTSNVIQL